MRAHSAGGSSHQRQIIKLAFLPMPAEAALGFAQLGACNVSDTAYPIGKYPPVNQDQFLGLRANAIQAYANLEMSLTLLFAKLLGIPAGVAGFSSLSYNEHLCQKPNIERLVF
jgi:hypothetical protein